MPVSKKNAEPSEPTPVLTPYWVSECGRATVYVGDCRDVMSQMERDQFHAVVTDPPYHLTSGNVSVDWGAFQNRDKGDTNHDGRGHKVKKTGFMGKTWDGGGVAFDPATWEAVLHVAKPGTHLLSFGGTRTYHRMACAVEDGGWDIRDCIMWVYGSGFPKGIDVSKAVDKTLGAERAVVGKRNGSPNAGMMGLGESGFTQAGEMFNVYGEPVTEAARQWSGWNSSLKPAVEPIILARKPMSGTVAQCVLKHGTGAINIDGCRVGTEGGTTKIIPEGGYEGGKPGVAYCGSVDGSFNGLAGTPNGKGRWPANLIHDGSDEVVECFPNGEQRFFYTAKADDADRPHGKTKRSIPKLKLREDLTPEQREFVLAELVKAGVDLQLP